VVAGLLNPNGIQTYVYPFTLIAHSSLLSALSEWKSPDFHATGLRPYEALLIGSILCWEVSARPRRVADVIMVLGCIQASLLWRGAVPILAIVCAPIVAEPDDPEASGETFRDDRQMGTGGARGGGGVGIDVADTPRVAAATRSRLVRLLCSTGATPSRRRGVPPAASGNGQPAE
jgi:hypothetical protein